MPYQLAYVSTTTPWKRVDLLDLLRAARTKNEALGVTGVLLHRRMGFVQLLEGDEPTVRELYAAIRADTRHTNVTLVWDEHTEERWFAAWWMAFRDLEEDPVTEPGLTDVLRGPPDDPTFRRDVVGQLWSLIRPYPEQA